MREYKGYRTWRTLIRFDQVMFAGEQCLVKAYVPAIWGSENPVFFRVDHIAPQQVLDVLSTKQTPVRMHVYADLDAETLEHLVDSFNCWETE